MGPLARERSGSLPPRRRAHPRAGARALRRRPAAPLLGPAVRHRAVPGFASVDFERVDALRPVAAEDDDGPATHGDGSDDERRRGDDAGDARRNVGEGDDAGDARRNVGDLPHVVGALAPAPVSWGPAPMDAAPAARPMAPTRPPTASPAHVGGRKHKSTRKCDAVFAPRFLSVDPRTWRLPRHTAPGTNGI